MTQRQAMSAIEMRHIALSAVRGFMRSHMLDPLKFPAHEAHEVLDDMARLQPDLIASRWYRSASSAQLSRFYQEWEAWRQETQRMLSRPS